MLRLAGQPFRLSASSTGPSTRLRHRRLVAVNIGISLIISRLSITAIVVTIADVVSCSRACERTVPCTYSALRAPYPVPVPRTPKLEDAARSRRGRPCTKESKLQVVGPFERFSRPVSAIYLKQILCSLSVAVVRCVPNYASLKQQCFGRFRCAPLAVSVAPRVQGADRSSLLSSIFTNHDREEQEKRRE